MSEFELVERSWDINRRSRRDVQRHQEKVRQAIRGNIGEIISQEDVITSDGQKIVKVPIRGLELPRFRFDPYGGQRAGQGDEGTRGRGMRTKRGTVLEKEDGKDGKGKQAGGEPGVDFYEAEITVDELVDLAYQDLALPNLEDKGKQTMTAPTVRFTTLRKTGPQANLDKRRTLIEAFKRAAREGRATEDQPDWTIDPSQDARYRSWEVFEEPQRNAVVFAMRDISGSMGETEAYLIRTFYTWMTRFLKRTYSGVEVVFITCHTEAKEVSEEEFFHAGGSGGTRMASAYELALNLTDRRYNSHIWNIYPFLFSDGFNWGDDICVSLVRDLLKKSNLVGYGETGEMIKTIMPDGRTSSWAPLGMKYEEALANEPRFVMARVTGKGDVWPALRKFMSRRHQELAA